LGAADAGVELPLKLAGGGIECNHFLRLGEGVEHAAYDQRVELEDALFAGVEGPGNLEAMNIRAIDLRERGIVVALRWANLARYAQNENCQGEG
jgi:hypothetical protein